MSSEERLDRCERLLVQQGELIEKHESAIRDLIVVGRTTLTAVERIGGSVQELAGSVQKLTGSVEELREAQRATDEKLNALIDTIERIIRRLNEFR
jgi:methyl-accepting chemotaxis protein